MPLVPGSRLGAFEILGLLGAGGMGEVYRARDTRLDRIVAIKVLPEHVSADAGRAARFAREAKMIAQLNHPHICTLHDVGEAPAPGSADADGRRPTVQYLVMELLDGETLAQRLGRAARSNGPALPTAEVLRIGAEIADALHAAHKLGIVHRDLKPSNVMLTKDGSGGSGVGSVRLLDFGLAKLREAEGRDVSDGSAPTATSPITHDGEVLGTRPYMAPEQVEGKATDARTDLWALGCVLYEMVTGQQAFTGDSVASITAAILEREPEPLSIRQPLVPPALEHVVRKCLAKAPDDRWDSAHDIAHELRWIAESGQVITPAIAERRPARRALAVLTLIAVAAVSAALTWFYTRSPTQPGPEVRQKVIDTSPADSLLPASGGAQTTLNRPSRTEIVLTSDGRRLVFAGSKDGQAWLYVRDVWGESEATPIPHTEGADAPFMSPNDEWVGFWADGMLKKVRLEGGGPPTVICPTSWADQAPHGASWGDDGTIVFSQGEFSTIWRVSGDGGDPEPITSLEASERDHRLPQLLPGGKVVLFTVVEQLRNWDTTRVVAHRLGTAEHKVILTGAADARYVSTGHIIFMRRGRLFAVPFDVERLEKTGDEVGLMADVMQSTNSAGATTDIGSAQVAMSTNGTLAYVTGGEVPDIPRTLVWVDREGRTEPIPVEPRPFYAPKISPDGRRLAVHTFQSDARLWVHDFAVPGSLVPVTSPDLRAREAVWTADGEWLMFDATPKGIWGLFRSRVDGSDSEEQLAEAEGSVPASRTPNGELLYIRREGQQSDIWLLSPGDNKWTGRPLLATEATEVYAQLSPDGRSLAYTSDESGLRVYLRSFPDLTDRRAVSGAESTSPVWARDGRELFYVRDPQGAQELVAHEVRPDGTLAPEGRVLFPLRLIRAPVYTPVPGFDVAPDGKRFVFTQYPEGDLPPPPSQVHIVENWFEELKAKVPERN